MPLLVVFSFLLRPHWLQGQTSLIGDFNTSNPLNPASADRMAVERVYYNHRTGERLLSFGGSSLW